MNLKQLFDAASKRLEALSPAPYVPSAVPPTFLVEKVFRGTHLRYYSDGSIVALPGRGDLLESLETIRDVYSTMADEYVEFNRSRVDFESYAKRNGLDIALKENNVYLERETNTAFAAWLEAKRTYAP